MTNVLNTLYVTVPKAFVGREGQSLKVKVERETRLQVPLHHLVSVVCFGPVLVSAEAMEACAEAGVAVSFLGQTGRFLARVEGRLSRTATLRRAQYQAADEASRCLAIARGCVAGKIANSRVQLRRAARTREDDGGTIAQAADRLKTLGERVLHASDLGALRGMEGEAAARYFQVFDAMLGPSEMAFEKRSRRPPENGVNALLSFGYALLSQDCMSAVQAAGLDPAVGFLHAERPGRPAMALDLMEEFRSVVVDRMVLAMVRLKQIKTDSFERLPTGETRMSDAARRVFLAEYQTRKQEEVTHPLTGQTGAWALMPHIQARVMARAIRGECEGSGAGTVPKDRRLVRGSARIETWSDVRTLPGGVIADSFAGRRGLKPSRAVPRTPGTVIADSFAGRRGLKPHARGLRGQRGHRRLVRGSARIETRRWSWGFLGA